VRSFLSLYQSLYQREILYSTYQGKCENLWTLYGRYVVVEGVVVIVSISYEHFTYSTTPL